MSKPCVYALETDKDVIKIYDWFFNSGYDICYTYKDKNNQVVYSVVMTPADYTKAKESGWAFRCDRNAWNEILSQVEKDLPMSYMGDCFLKEVSADFDNNVLNYVVALPDNVFSLYITEEYLENYIKENMEALSDYLWTMAGIDKMDLHYHFVTASGKAHAKIVIPCGEYK